MGTEDGNKASEPEGIVYRYDRRRRLERAAPEVRWLESRRSGKKPGFLSYLLATRASRILFALILGLALYFLASPIFERAPSDLSLGGSSWSAEALWYEDRVLVVLTREGARAEAGALLEADFSLQGAQPERRSLVLAGGEREEFRLSLARAGAKPATLRIELALGDASGAMKIPVR